MNVSLKQQGTVAGQGDASNGVADRVKSLRNRTVLFLLSRVTNSHSRRILFLTSLYCRVVRLEHLRDDTIDQINTLLSLAKRREALRLPAAVRNIVWTNEALNSKIHEELHRKEFDPIKAEELAQLIISDAVDWMWYDDPKRMTQDIVEMLASVFQDVERREPALA